MLNPTITNFENNLSWVYEVAQQVRVLVTNPNSWNQCSKENQLPQTVLCPPNGCSNTPNTHTCIINNH